MVSKEKFIKLLQEYAEFCVMESKIKDLFGMDYFESPLFEIPWRWFEDLLKVYVKPEYMDTVSAYIWPEDDLDIEMKDRPEHPLYLYAADCETIENTIGTYEDLYNYLKANDGFNTNC